MSDQRTTSERLRDLADRLRDLADRIEQGGAVSWDEIGQVFADAGQDLIDALEEKLAAAGEAPLPARLNPGRPEFHAAIERLRALHGAGVETDAPEYVQTFLDVHRWAPPWMTAEINRIGDEMGLLPPPDMMSANGEPLHSVAALARHFGTPEARLLADLKRLQGGDLPTGPAAFHIH